ncbi:MAG: hypothetical protein ACFFDN_48515, partial [Candidatus Hodarchaeota archaeon]
MKREFIVKVFLIICFIIIIAILFSSIALLFSSLFSSCYDGNQSADSEIAKKQELQQNELNNQIELPNIKNFTEKKLLK